MRMQWGSGVSQVRNETNEFRPPWWLRNPHVQTILAARLLKPPVPSVETERLELEDGDFLDLAHAPAQGPARATVCLFHGLAGCVSSAYISGAINTLTASRYRVTLMHWRGCSGEPNRLARSYHSGATDDVMRLGQLLRKRFADEPLAAVGWSLGGNALLVHLGQSGEASPFDAALSVCPPLVLSVGADKLDTGFTRNYQRYLLGLMRAQIEAKRHAYPELELPPAGPDLNTFWRFDDALTAPLHGYRDVHHYYTECSARQWLGGIKRPTHILASEDDPFFTPAILPAASELAPGTTLEVSAHGGHVGFIGARGSGAHRGAPQNSRRWLDQRVAKIVSNLLDGL